MPNLQVRGAGRKLLFVAVAVFACASMLRATGRAWLADRTGAQLTQEGLRAAVEYEPDNAERHYGYARYLEIIDGDFDGAAASLRRATQLNRNVARYWIELAKVQRFLGDVQGEGVSLRNAMMCAPTDPKIARDAAVIESSRAELERR